MLYRFLYSFVGQFPLFNIFRYITVRSFLALFTGFFITLVFLKWMIRFFRNKGVFQQTRSKDECPNLADFHKEKSSTPTFGGVGILLGFIIATLLWMDAGNPFFPWLIGGAVVLGVLGLVDDVSKLKSRSAKGVRGKVKLAVQALFGIAFGIWLVGQKWFDASLYLPFLKDVYIPLGIVFPLFAALVITAASNAVNLTDGMDGLAIGCYIFVIMTFAVFLYLAGNAKWSSYLYIPYVPYAGEATIACAGILGAALGFLWHNAYPADIFMGDVGSLSLGGLLGMFAVIAKQEILLLLAGGVFVFETLSVIIQVFSYKTFGKRVFRVAPAHHHFHLGGRHESKVIIRFWIITLLLCIVSLASIKLR